jgi:hypothetical protein
MSVCSLRRPIVLKLDGDLGLVSQIGLHVLVSRFDCLFPFSKQTKKRRNFGFLKHNFSAMQSPIDLKLDDFCLFTFHKHKLINTLLRISWPSEDVLKLGGCLHLTPTHNSAKLFFKLSCFLN